MVNESRSCRGRESAPGDPIETVFDLLSEFPTKESIDELVASFEELAEELTPYFQKRVRSVSPQQARIVQLLCNTTNIAEEFVYADRPNGLIRRSQVLRLKGQLAQALEEIAEVISLQCLKANQKSQ